MSIGWYKEAQFLFNFVYSLENIPTLEAPLYIWKAHNVEWTMSIPSIVKSENKIY